MNITSDTELRARNAYFRFDKDGTRDQPSDFDDFKFEGKSYVVVSNREKVLAVYRVRNDGGLRMMARPPKGLVEQYEDAG